MPLAKSIQLLEQTLFDRQLTDSEHQVLLQVIQGKSYGAITQDTSYIVIPEKPTESSTNRGSIA